MAAQVFTTYSGEFTDSKGKVFAMKVVLINGRAHLIVEDNLDMGLVGNFSDVNVGMTDPSTTGKHIVPLKNTNGDDYELDTTNSGVPVLAKKT